MAELEGEIVGIASDHARQVHFMVKNGAHLARIPDEWTQQGHLNFYISRVTVWHD